MRSLQCFYIVIHIAVSTSKQASSKKQHLLTAGSAERELRAQLRVRPSQCPKDKPYVDCSIVSPCKAQRLFNTQCESYPDAICINNYCGGCVAQHYVGGKEVFCGKEDNVICELQNTSLSCPTNHLMVVKHANYGRTNPYTCRHFYNLDAMHNNTRCYSEGATEIVRELCEGKTICSLDVSDQTFGDPCHKIYKYLQVDFDCLPVRKYIHYSRDTAGADNIVETGNGTLLTLRSSSEGQNKSQILFILACTSIVIHFILN